ncbi:MAG: ABC transporter permease, partial [Chloroflexi bacterium]|nr:ABC transporter permease [Chloroflexota bacterium]
MYIKPRWRKVLRDILANRARTILVVLAIAVGVFAFGSVFITQEVLLREMNQGFASSNPANLVVNMARPFNDSLLRTVRTFDGVEDAEARATATVNARNGDQWIQLNLIAVPDFDQLSISAIDLEAGTLDPQRREILIERRSMLPLRNIGDKELGDTLTIELADGTLHDLQIVGIVHDFYATPGNIAPILTGYVTIDTLRLYGLSESYNELHIQVEPAINSGEALQDYADELTDELNRYGYPVAFTDVQESDEHWASDLVQALVTVLGAIGFLALALSAFLVINTVTAILSQQKRQIGMMKAVGARAQDVLGIYLVMSVTFGILSLFVALPIGVGIAYGLTQAIGFLLNVNINSFSIPPYVLGLQLLTAIVTPLIAAFIPVISGTRITVREAVSDYGIGTSAEATGIIAAISRFIDNVVNGAITAIRGIPRPTKLSLRNTFRRKGRLVLTLLTLSTAGAIFMAVINVRGSLLVEFDKILSLFGYDAALFLSEPQPVNRLEREAMRIDGVTRVEGWGFA